MKLSLFLIKLILSFGFIALMFAPLAGIWSSFKVDRDKKNAHKRFRLVVFSAIYFLAISVLLIFIRDFMEWVKTWEIVRWLASHIGLPDRFEYSVAVFTAILLNCIIGLLYIILTPIARIGLKKKKLDFSKRDKEENNENKDENEKKKDESEDKRGGKGKKKGESKLEIKIIAYFYDAKWRFAAHVMKYLCIAMIGIFAVVFALYPIPALWKFDWLPMDKVSAVFNAGYHYPVLTLIPLIEITLFLYGVSLYELKDEKKPEEKVGTRIIDPALEEIDKNLRNEFKYHFTDELADIPDDGEVKMGDYTDITELIARGVEKDTRRSRQASEIYMQCLDTIVRNDIDSLVKNNGEKSNGVLVNASFFSEFSEYFLRYASVILARGDNMVFICNDDSQIEDTEKYIRTALEQMYSLYHLESDKADIDFNYSVWKVVAHTSESPEDNCEKINNCSVLITDLAFLTSSLFETGCRKFIHLIDTAVFVDTLTTVNEFAHQMSIFEVSMKNIREKNAVLSKNCCENGNCNNIDPFAIRYVSNQIKYICFDDSRVPGWDRVLNNLLYVEFTSANAMKYNPSSKVVLYNFEARADENGDIPLIQAAQTTENLSVLINISDFAVGFGAGRVSVLADRMIPYRDLEESAEANKGNGLRLVEDTNFTVNKHSYDSDQYRVFVAFDDMDNLPMAIRKYSSMASNRPTLVMLFSRPYMFRDYYLENIDELWKSEQMLRIPFEQKSRENAIRKILIKANSGGIAFKEIFDILTNANIDDYKKPISTNDINEVLRQILIDCGKHVNEAFAWTRYFECYYFNDYVSSGKFVSEDRVRLRRKGMLYDLLPAAQLAKMYIDGKDIEQSLPIPACRITQNYIVGQNMLFRGNVYTINNIDTANGKIYVHRATGGRNDTPYRYIQDRKYYVHYSTDTPETVYPVKSVSFTNSKETKVSGATVAVTRRPMEVITNGYLPIDPRKMENNAASADRYVHITGDEHIEEFKQTYRKYGNVENPICSSDTIMNGKSEHKTLAQEALVMSIKLKGEFGANADRIALLASVMIKEVIASMFPSVVDSIAVCPVLHNQFADEDIANIRSRFHELEAKGYTPEDDTIELLIIEDAPLDLGVVAVLMSSGDDVIKMLFAPINKYLEWYSQQTVKSKYLYFGGDEEPACFDFEGLAKLAHTLGDEDIKYEFRNVQEVTKYDVCDFCGKKYLKGSDVAVLDDGRKICKHCQKSIVSYDKNSLDAHLESAKSYLERTYGIKIDRDAYEFCYESTAKIVRELSRNRDLVQRGADIPLKSYMNSGEDRVSVHVEHNIPSVNFSELLVRELTHIWQRKNLPNLKEDLAEGHIALVAIQYLRFLNQHSLASMRTSYYESTANDSGVGYRALVRELLINTQFANNPFAYLLHMSGKNVEEEISHHVPRVLDDGDYGKAYIAKTADRALDGNITYFYYSRLIASHQKMYDAMLEAICEHRDVIQNQGCSGDDLKKICYAILYDHPELFWFNWIKWDETDFNRIKLLYGVSKEERDVLQRRLDEVVPKYLEGIDDNMSAYDVAVRIHVKIINAVDYDTIALERQKKAGGPKADEIDYLRSICGIFLNGTAVCEGYARGVQYLLQKCGIECAEAAGDIRKDTGENGGAHAWNIVKIDGDYYYIDTTWDDSSNTVQSVRNTDFGFDYFCITSEELARTRYLDGCPTDMPPCDATRANYYVHNDLVLNSFDIDKIGQNARAAAESKKRSFTFKCATSQLFNEIFDRFTNHDEILHEPISVAQKVNKDILDGFSYTYNKHIRTITYIFNCKS